VKIPNEYTIVINLGDSFVRKGTKLIIYEEGTDIIDPDTKEKLGRFDLTKDTVEVVEVYDAYSVCQKIEYIEEEGGILRALSPMMTKKTTQKTILKLDVLDNENLSLQEPQIRIGDPVKIN
ncbi:MAG: hypothetical protein RSA63_11950, partial [Eubacterium sp.]